MFTERLRGILWPSYEAVSQRLIDNYMYRLRAKYMYRLIDNYMYILRAKYMYRLSNSYI